MPTNQTTRRQDLANDVKRLQDASFASDYGLSRDFITKNSKIVSDANKAVNDVLLGYGIDNISKNSNAMRDLTNLVRQSMRYSDKRMPKSDTTYDPYYDSATGIKNITPVGNIDTIENDIISENAKLIQSFLNVTQEYRGVAKLIPEVGHAIQNIARDILNVSELSDRAFNDIYEEDKNISSTDESKRETLRCNDLLQKEIVDKNNLEIKWKKWLIESITCGVKPIAFIPYDYIIRQVQHLAKNAGFDVDIAGMKNKTSSMESFTVCKNDEDREKFYKTAVESSFADMIDPKKVTTSTEAETIQAAVDTAAENEYDKLFDDSFVEEYAHFCENEFDKLDEVLAERKEDIEDSFNKRFAMTGEKSTEAMQEQLDILQVFEKKHNEDREEAQKLSKEERLDKARKGIRTLARWIDSNIDVVKPGASSAIIADKIMSQKDRYSKFYNLGENYILAEGVRKKKMDENETRYSSGSRNDGMGFDNTSTLGKNCLIVPYAPESVVPINVNGEYMGFYCMEYEHIAGPQWRNRRRAGSFTDYVQQQGYMNDSNFLGGNAPMVAYGGSDPLENNLYSPLSLYNYSVSQYMYGGQNQEDQRYDMMKSVVLRVLAHRLRDPDLVNNKMFKDATMTLLRNDCLTKNKVQFTFIPPEYMCYCTYQVDDDGVPMSILDGTLFFAYLYISSVVSSAMIKLLKSADKEKYEVNVGLQKNMGYTIEELQRTLSTRQLFNSGMFGSLSTVIRNAGSYSRMIIPVFHGEKLYDVTQIERMNDLNPDDEFTKNLLQSIMNKIYVNAGALSQMDDVDFAKQLSMRNLDYRNNIVDAQKNYKYFITRSIQLLTCYSDLDTFNSEIENIADENLTEAQRKEEEERRKNAIDLSRINVRLSAPTLLNMANIIEMVDNAKNTANSIAEALNLQDDNGINTARNTIFKTKLIKRYCTNIDWTELQTLLDESALEAPAYVQQEKKTSKVDETIQNPPDTGGDMGGGGAGGMDDMGGGMDMGAGY